MRPLYFSSAMGTVPKDIWEAAFLHHQSTENGPTRGESRPQQQHHLPCHTQHEALLLGCSFRAPRWQGEPVGGLLPQRESSECWSPQAWHTSAWAQGEAEQCQQEAWSCAVTSVSLQHPAQWSQENRDIPWLLYGHQHATAHPRVTTEQSCPLSESHFMQLHSHACRALPQHPQGSALLTGYTGHWLSCSHTSSLKLRHSSKAVQYIQKLEVIFTPIGPYATSELQSFLLGHLPPIIPSYLSLLLHHPLPPPEQVMQRSGMLGEKRAQMGGGRACVQVTAWAVAS